MPSLLKWVRTVLWKAATEGSALGVYLCEGAEEIADAIDKVFQVDTCAFVESFVSGEEFTVAVLGNRGPRALSLLSKLFLPTSSTILSRSTLRGGSQHICPAPLSEEDTKRAMELAVAAHKTLECRGVSRSDLIKDGEGNFWVLETNTIPGMTATSLLPDGCSCSWHEFC